MLRKTFDELDVVPTLDEDLIERIQLKWSVLADARAKRDEERRAAIIEMATKPIEAPVKKKATWLVELQEMRRAMAILSGELVADTLPGESKKKDLQQAGEIVAASEGEQDEAEASAPSSSKGKRKAKSKQ